jgi:hypothetical protein
MQRNPASNFRSVIMRELFTNRTLDLPAGHAVSGIASRAQALRILRGRVWLTVEGIDQDYFLRAGDTFTAIPGRLVVLEADRDAGIELPRPARQHRLWNIFTSLAAITMRWSRGVAVQTSFKRNRPCDAC